MLAMVSLKLSLCLPTFAERDPLWRLLRSLPATTERVLECVVELLVVRGEFCIRWDGAIETTSPEA